MTGKRGAAASVQEGTAQKPQQAQREAGAGFGDEQYSPMVRVEFEPEQIPFTWTIIKYEWYETLCRKRILSCMPLEYNRLWDEGGMPYAPFLPGYSLVPSSR